MALRAISQAEREELEAILKAKVLVRSPSVLRIAEYIIRKYLEGQADGLKEYNIAVEALGKPADFDPKRDSIVRVEAHRLRKKLAEFYQTEGSAHTLRIVIDPGQYVPRFASIDQPESRAETGLSIVLRENVLPEKPVARPSASILLPANERPRFRTLLLLAFAVVLPALVFLAWRFLWPPLQLVAIPEAVRLISGAPEAIVVVSSPTGARWRGDNWFRGGNVVNGGQPVTEAAEVPLSFQRHGNFDYDIPLSNSPYELRLHFSPRMFPTGGAAITAHGFDVLANGQKLLDALDPGVSRRIQDRAITRVFHDIRPAGDGLLHLSFRNGSQIAYVNAIELTPGEAGKLMPIRIVAKAAPYTEPNGRTWRADEYLTGGTLTVRTERVIGNLDQNVMSGERYGTFIYEIPVSRGQYGLKLYFAERWFGSKVNGGGAGSRRFDVYANGTPLLQDFDIFLAAGQRNRVVVKEFHGLVPNADGYINLDFIPRVNNACISALELTDESN
jgi:hypothetical protein